MSSWSLVNCCGDRVGRSGSSGSELLGAAEGRPRGSRRARPRDGLQPASEGEPPEDGQGAQGGRGLGRPRGRSAASPGKEHKAPTTGSKDFKSHHSINHVFIGRGIMAGITGHLNWHLGSPSLRIQPKQKAAPWPPPPKLPPFGRPLRR